MIRTIEWSDEGVVMIDQRLLPTREVYNTYKSVKEVADAIVTMVIRGAPAIGVAAAMGIALGVEKLSSKENLRHEFERICKTIHDTRPTAQNLFWAIERMKRVFEAHAEAPLSELQAALREESVAMHREDIEINRRMGEHGQRLLEENMSVLTHCNAGALATAGYGTALGVIRAAAASGKNIRVFADETRPFLQGSRLTAWEMMKEAIPCTLITDSMAGYFMRAGRIQAVIVGADRIAANGDVANKIGTYSVAVLAQHHGIPFYVAAPLSTIDRHTPSGQEIPIEERDTREVTEIKGQRLAPDSITVANPAFDVTPGHLVSAIITEAGIARSPYPESLAALFEKAAVMQ
ncbi:MAG: S-methyl-5-thioribose-1-phosphate isomerase [Acidobacteriota bacterium]